LNGTALPVTDRMNGRLQAKRMKFACAANADKGGD
jgi:soluble lytic murein transglycosylase